MRKVNISVPFVYAIEATKPRQRTPRQFYLGEVKDFEITALDESEAPVAARWLEADRRDEWHRKEVRVIDDHFYKPVTKSLYEPVTKSLNTDVMSVEQLSQKDFSTRKHNPLISYSESHEKAATRFAFGQFMDGTLDTGSYEDYSSVFFSDHYETVKALHEISSSLVIIGEQVWQKTTEPLLLLKLKGSHSRSTEYYITKDNIYVPTQAHVFPLYDFDAMLKFANDFHEGSEGELSTFASVKDLDVYMPDAFEFNGEKHNVTNLYKNVCSHFEKHVLETGRAAANAWFDLNEAFEAEETPDKIDTLMAAIKNFVNEMKSSDLRTDMSRLKAVENYVISRGMNLSSFDSFKM